jgi:hypothetical protein
MLAKILTRVGTGFASGGGEEYLPVELTPQTGRTLLPQLALHSLLTRLYLLTREQVACRHVQPAGTCFHQLIAGNRESVLEQHPEHVEAIGMVSIEVGNLENQSRRT